MGDEPMSVPEAMRRHGVTVTGVIMLRQIAEKVERSGAAEIYGDAADNILVWLRALRAELAEGDANG